MSEKNEGIDRYTKKAFYRCPGCGGRVWVAAQGMLDNRIQKIWVCKGCAYPRERKE